jgi:hypothetical protein
MQTYLIVGPLILATLVFMPDPASAVDARVEVGCASDYMAYRELAWHWTSVRAKARQPYIDDLHPAPCGLPGRVDP